MMFTASQSGRARRAPDREPEAGAELRRLAPAEIAARHDRLVERHDLVARMAGIVRDDGARPVDQLHQLPDHAIGAERRGLRGQARAATRSMKAPRTSATALSVASRRSPRASPTGVEQLQQHEARVADAAEGDVVAGREIAAVVGDLPERRPGGHRRDVERAREARADAEHEVGLREEAVDGGRPRAARGAERERVVLGERALAVERRRHRRAGELGQAHQLGRRAGVEHALAREDHRVLGREQRPSRSRRRRRRSPASDAAATSARPSRPRPRAR